MESAEPPDAGPGLGDLNGAFTITRWEAGRLAVYSASETAPGGRPFVDGVEVRMGRPLRDQAIDLELGRADIVELGAAEMRRAVAGRRVWASAPVRLVALVFGPRVTDARLREAVALVVDRQSIHSVLLQGQGEVTAALLPQWLSGYAFLFSVTPDVERARRLAAALPPSARNLTLSAEDPAWQTVAARVALNARDAGLTITIGSGKAADLQLVEVRIGSADPVRALADTAAALDLGDTTRAGGPEALYEAERALLDTFRAIPMFHLPYVYGAAARVKGETGITPLGGWQFENLWLEAARP